MQSKGKVLAWAFWLTLAGAGTAFAQPRTYQLVVSEDSTSEVRIGRFVLTFRTLDGHQAVTGLLNVTVDDQGPQAGKDRYRLQLNELVTHVDSSAQKSPNRTLTFLASRIDFDAKNIQSQTPTAPTDSLDLYGEASAGWHGVFHEAVRATGTLTRIDGGLTLDLQAPLDLATAGAPGWATRQIGGSVAEVTMHLKLRPMNGQAWLK